MRAYSPESDGEEEGDSENREEFGKHCRNKCWDKSAVAWRVKGKMGERVETFDQRAASRLRGGKRRE